MATCPVCGAGVDETAARQSSGMTAHGAKETDPARGTRQFHDGQWVYFDSLDCRNKFLRSPDTYLKPSS